MSTFVTFVQDVANLTVTGVKRKLLAPPAVMGTADLPLSFPRIPSQVHTYRTFSESNRSGTVELVIAVAPDTLNLRGSVFADACALVDNLNTALSTLPVVDRWSVRLGAETFDGGATAHTVLIATVEGSW